MVRDLRLCFPRVIHFFFVFLVNKTMLLLEVFEIAWLAVPSSSSSLPTSFTTPSSSSLLGRSRTAYQWLDANMASPFDSDRFAQTPGATPRRRSMIRPPARRMPTTPHSIYSQKLATWPTSCLHSPRRSSAHSRTWASKLARAPPILR